jgi:hypothetical protein
MDLADLKVNLLKTKGAVDFYEELSSSKIGDKKILSQKLLLVQGEILKLAMKTEHIIKELENKFRK